MVGCTLWPLFIFLPIDQINQKNTKNSPFSPSSWPTSSSNKRKKTLQVFGFNLAQIYQINHLNLLLFHKTSSLSVGEVIGEVVWKAKVTSCSLSCVAKVSCEGTPLLHLMMFNPWFVVVSGVILWIISWFLGELVKFYNYWWYFCFNMIVMVWPCMMIGNDI